MRNARNLTLSLRHLKLTLLYPQTNSQPNSFLQIQEPKFKIPRIFLLVLLLCFFSISGCGSKNKDELTPREKQLQGQIEKLQEENARLKTEVEILKVQLSNPAAETTPSPTASATKSLKPVTFEDIKGGFGEKEITQLAQLGVFDTTSGKFNPQGPITRAEFVRWLVRANNAIYAGSPDKTIRLSDNGKATFSDVPDTRPDSRYIQAMTNAGFAIGYDDKTFKPDQILTREQMLGIKVALDHRVAMDVDTDSPPGEWTDSNKIAKKYWPALYIETVYQNNANIGRIFGTIKTLKPQAPVTRAEAAVAIWAISDRTNGFTTAEEALQQ